MKKKLLIAVLMFLVSASSVYAQNYVKLMTLDYTQVVEVESGLVQTLDWMVELTDPSDLHVSSMPDLITVQADGFYSVACTVRFPASTMGGGSRKVYIATDEEVIAANRVYVDAGEDATVSASGLEYLTMGTNLICRVWQDSGETLEIRQYDHAYPVFSVGKLE